MTATPGPTPFSAPTATAPAYDTFSITPSDTDNFASMARAIYVGVAGNITLVTSKGTVQEFIAVPQGTILPVVCVRVNDTSTDASSLVGLI